MSIITVFDTDNDSSSFAKLSYGSSLRLLGNNFLYSGAILSLSMNQYEFFVPTTRYEITSGLYSTSVALAFRDLAIDSRLDTI